MNCPHHTFSYLLRGACLLAVSLSVSWPLSAVAALGAAPQAGAQQRVPSPDPGFTAWESLTNSGIHVREYAAADGQVFAVRWDGPFMPDLRVLLGAYYVELQSSSAPHTALHASLNVTLTDLVVHAQGHVRAFAGEAYLPQQLPAGVDPTRLP